jgi:ribosomal protein L33
MSLACRNCGVRNFRLSRFRKTDLVRVLLLQFPVRCRECRERGYAFILDIFKLKSARNDRRSDSIRTRAR